ncbi:MAG: sugar phosphate isomerase/epimerase family protein [Lachnospiraceae bacterium]|jgi:3-dehydroshikimate dehydratase
MLIPGIVSVTYKKESPAFVIDAAKAAGLKAIEWSENWHVPAGDVRAAEDLYRRTREAGLQIAAYGSYFKLGTEEDPAGRFDQSLRAACAMHAPIIRIWGGVRASTDVTEPEWERMADEARQAAAAAEKAGIKVALEWHRNTVTDTNESAERFLRDVNSRNLYCLWQPTMALSIKERTDGIDMLEKKGRLLNLHVYYWEEDGRYPLAEGAGLWREYLRHVKKSEDRFALMEFVRGDTKEQLVEDAKTLLKLVGGFNG